MPSVFLCHASEDKPIVERIQLALASAGLDVFFDAESLPPAGDYQARIQEAILKCDVFVFVATDAALSPGRFPLTELKFARERWVSPVGRVLPVVLGSGRAVQLPPYLQQVTPLVVSGNAAAEVRSAVEAMLKDLKVLKVPKATKPMSWQLQLIVAVVVAFGVLAWRLPPARPPSTPPQVMSPPEPARPAEAYIAVEYARLFGAVEVPIVLRLQGTGEPDCQPTVCVLRGGGNFTPQLAQFWRSSWPYQKSLLISSPPLRAMAQGDTEYALKMLARVDNGLSKCMYRKLHSWLEGSGLLDGPTNCRREESRVVGFLFLIIRNISERYLTDVALSYQDLPRTTLARDYLRSLETDTRVIGARQQAIAGLRPNDSAIILLTVYQRDRDGFEKKFLDDGLLPREISFKVEAQPKAMLVRGPRREKAFVAELPLGWYLQ